MANFKWDKPMNPYAAEDFTNAVREASTKFGEDLKKIGEQMKANVADAKISFIDFDDMPTEYSGVMRLASCTMWEDVVKALLGNGYEVAARLEDATETEREVDGVEKWIVIEYGEVE